MVVTAASVPDRDGALELFARFEPFAQRLAVIFADSNYAGWLVHLVQYLASWTLVIVKKLAQQEGFVVLPKRWIVERTFAWLGKYRRLSKDYEFRPESSEAMILWATVHRMTRKITFT